MKLDKFLIRQIMNRLNKGLFQDQLQLSEIPVKITKSKRRAAEIAFTRDLSRIAHVGVSNQFQWTTEELIDTLAHELVHVYEVQIAKVMPSHEGVFLDKMIEINNMNVGIVISETTKMPLKNKLRMVG